MIFLIVVVVLIALISYCWSNKLIIRFDTVFRKGFRLQKDVYGVYCFTR